MTNSVNVILTHESLANDWQQSQKIQLVDGQVYLYLPADTPFMSRAVQSAARTIQSMGVQHAVLTGDAWSEVLQWSFALGFTTIKSLESVSFTGDEACVERLNNKLQVFAWARSLTNQDAGTQSPQVLAQTVIDYLTSVAPSHITARIIQGEELAEQGWMGVYNVGKGSDRAPCLVEIDYNPSQKDDADVFACLVGKGITFDTGGYSIKPSEGMFDMKSDMGGASTVSGALALAIKQGLNKRVKLILCNAENMISGHAYRVSDIIHYKNGISCEVANTDAEGRLVLADGLLLAGESNPEMIIDAATLTGAAVLATGGDYTAMFSLDDNAAEQAKNAATMVNEPLWQLPLEPWHQDKCPSAFADTANSRTVKGGGAGGASNAAGFLSRFVPEQGKGWLHFDLAAAYNGSSNSLWAAGATGTGIATIAQLLLK
ncbi:aminopeptidase PepB [Thalassotalea marina]|uniref:Aminopeptidase n=1 Tax=Thalassotalea marina TaxID=1673741 RepID=A0A919BPI2_9GAMM|nr:aminopeptidase PepB [Thalassotalea marina]GHG04594.1 aminopeptidase [Thalassotalea marina]